MIRNFGYLAMWGNGLMIERLIYSLEIRGSSGAMLSPR